MAQSGVTCASPVAVTPLAVPFRLEATTGTKGSPIPNSESAKKSPIPSKPTSETVSLVSASSHLTPLPQTACCVSSPSPTSAEDLETPPLLHVAKAEREIEGSENESLPALLARVRPPPFPFEGGREGNGDDEEEEEEEQELPEPARSAANAAADDDGASSSSSVHEALGSLALVDEA